MPIKPTVGEMAVKTVKCIKANDGGVMPPLPCPQLADVKVVLASNSPRRRELLGMILPEFYIAESKDVDESYPADMEAEQVPVYLSQIKAEAYRPDLEPGELLITADTVVIVDGKILGKPSGYDDAVAMIKMLAGRTHRVVTGVTLSSIDCSLSFSDSTDVTFRRLGDEEIREYVQRYKPFDKAGAYGIQEWIGGAGIRGMNGCFYNVMGLPLSALYEELKKR